MKIKYEFLNGDIAIVEVDEELGMLILASRRKESSANRYHRRWCRSLDAVTDKSIWGVDHKSDPCHMIQQMTEDENKQSETIRIRLALDSLSQKQRRLVKALFIDRLTEEEYAEITGVTQSAIAHQMATIRKKIKKLL
jgi:RNA polymerase sigma factor (sigma-70 family)